MKRWKCTVCKQVFEGQEPPVPCPVCGAGREAFVLLEEDEAAQALPAAETAASSKTVKKWYCTVCGQVFEGEEPPVPCPVCKAGREAFKELKDEKQAYKKDTDDKFLIIGGGLAALQAAKAIRKRNSTAWVTIVADEIHYPYNRPALSGVLAKGGQVEKLFLEPKSFYEAEKIEVRTGVLATSVDTTAKEVVLSSGGRLPYTKLLLATGSFPFNPIQHSPNAIPIHVLRCFEDAEVLAGSVKGKRVVVVGGGILGIEAVMALHAQNCQITIVEFAPRILSLQGDAVTSARLAAMLEALGVRILTGKSVVSAGAQGVQLNDGTEITADLVLASMGVRSRVELAAGMGLEISRGIVVDDFMRTGTPGIWAAGDCAEFSGRVLALAGAAAAMGAVAGASMAGDESVPYVPFTPSTYFSAQGFTLLSVGDIADTLSETVLYQNSDTGTYRKLFSQGGRLAGAIFLGETPGARAVQAVEEKVPLEKALPLLL